MKTTFNGNLTTVNKSILTFVLIICGSAGCNLMWDTPSTCAQEPAAGIEEKSSPPIVNDSEVDSDEQGKVEMGGESEDSLQSEVQSERKFTATHLVQLIVIGTVILWGYSLVMSGKHGTGWMVLATIFAVGSFFGRLIMSMFQEVTTENEVADWEDE